MFCRNCGQQAGPGAAICVKCGVKLGTGRSFCHNCGNGTDPIAVACTKCGAALNGGGQGSSTGSSGPKDWLTAVLLSFFIGSLGVDRFYMGYTTLGIIKLVTFGGCGIWTLIDFIMIVMNTLPDADGNPLVKK